jgi:hypothetical protein
MPRAYRRVMNTLVHRQVSPHDLPECGEVIALPGGRDRRTKPKRFLLIDGKPMRTPLVLFRGKGKAS